MSDNKTKKILIFSNLRNKKIIDKYVDCYVQTNSNATVSGTMESILLDSILPSDNETRNWISELFCDNRDIQWVVKTALNQLLSYSDTSIYNLTDALPLIRFINSELLSYKSFDVFDSESETNETIYFFTNLKYIIQTLESYNNESNGYEGLENSILGLSNLMQCQESFFNSTDFSQYVVQTIIKHWNILNSVSFIYSFLASLTRIINWGNSPERILEINDIIKKIEHVWNRKD